MPRRALDRGDWEGWRPTLVEWYRYRTADSIAEELKSDYGLNVTAKMLRDRFKLWNTKPKYSKHQPIEPLRRKPKRKTRPWVGDRVVEYILSVNTTSQSADEQFVDHVKDSYTESGQLESDAARYPILGLIKFNGTDVLITPPPSRTLGTPKEDWHLLWTLNETSGYLDMLVKENSWKLRCEEPAFELQKVAANAHMAISSQVSETTGKKVTLSTWLLRRVSPSLAATYCRMRHADHFDHGIQTYDCHQIWRELTQLHDPVLRLMPKFGKHNLLNLHPRSLIVLLRILVDSVSFTSWGSRTLENVKYMFWIVCSQTLQAAHPIRLLCGLPRRKAKELLFRLLELMDVRLFSRISDESIEGTIFVAQEQTYAARVLASLGYTQWAAVKLQSVIDNLDSHMDDFTKADAYRTLGFVKEQACYNANADKQLNLLQDARSASSSALSLFVELGKGCSNEAMFTRISLAQVSRRLDELAEAEVYLSEAISVWQKTRNGEDQGGSKLMLDLHQVLVDQQKFDAARELRREHQRYFEESRVYYEENGS